jgi:hypothetical protein
MFASTPLMQTALPADMYLQAGLTDCTGVRMRLV